MKLMPSKSSKIRSITQQFKQNSIAIVSLFIAVIGLTLNVLYMEHRELNSNLRTASFQLLIEISEFEKVTFQLQYDGKSEDYNARTGWVKVRLIKGLSKLTNPDISKNAETLFNSWQNHWDSLGENNSNAFNDITQKTNHLRESIIHLITQLD